MVWRHCADIAVLLTGDPCCFSDCKVKEPSALAKDPELAKKLWEKSVEMVGLKDYDMFGSDDTLPGPLKDV